MKKLIALLLLSALTASAQLQLIIVGTNVVSGVTNWITITGVCTNQPYVVTATSTNAGGGEVIGRNTWLKINASLQWLLTNTLTTSNAIVGYVNGNTNFTANHTVFENPLVTVSNIYPYSFGVSNYYGWWTNLYAVSGSGTVSLTNPTSVTQSFYMSQDGGSTYVPFSSGQSNLVHWLTTNVVSIGGGFYATNIYTNSGLAVILTSTAPTNSIGTFTASRLAHPELNGRTYYFYGETLYGLSGTNGGGTNFTVINVYSNTYVSTGSASNAIANLNGYGTNTTIGYSLTNLSYAAGSVVMTNTGISGANGTYAQDLNTNSSPFQSFPCPLQVNGYVVYSAWQFYRSYMLTNLAIWTNSTGWAIAQVPNVQADYANAHGGVMVPHIEGYGWFMYQQNYPPMYDANSLYPYYTSNGNPPWTAHGGATGSPTNATTYSTVTNYAFVPTTLSGQIVQPLTTLSFIVPIDATCYATNYTVAHNLGKYPTLVKWSFLCVSNDVETGIVPGQQIDLKDDYFIDTGNHFWTFATSSNATVCFETALAGVLDPYSPFHTSGGSFALGNNPGNFQGYATWQLSTVLTVNSFVLQCTIIP